MPISGVNANPYAPIVQSTEGLATLGDLVDYKAKLDAAKSLTAERNSQTAFRNQEVADRQRAAGEAARQQASIEAIKQKHIRGDGSLDTTGFMNELSAVEPEAAVRVGKAINEASTGLLNQQKSEREARADQASQIEELTRGIDKDPVLLARNLPKIQAINPDIAQYIASGDQNAIENARNQAMDFKGYNDHLKEIEKATDSAKGRALAQLVAARTPGQIDQAFRTIHTVGGDHDLEAIGVRPGQYNPATDNALVLSQIPGLTDEQRAKFALPEAEKPAASGGSDYSRFLGTFMQSEAAKLGKTPDQLDPATRVKIELAAKKAFGQADDRPPAAAAAQSGAGALSPEGIDYAATQYRVTGVMPSLGMGNSAGRAQIINAAAKQTKEVGRSPAAQIQSQAAYKSDSSSLTRMRTLADAANAAENKAFTQADIVSELSDKVDRTKWPIINSAIMAGKTEITGDSDATRLANAISTFTNEYGKIMEGSTASIAGSSDSGRAAAGRLLAAKMSKGTTKDVLELMKREMEATRQGYDATIQHITERMGGQPPPTTASPAAAAPTKPPQNPKVGDTWQSPTGPTRWNGKTWGPA